MPPKRKQKRSKSLWDLYRDGVTFTFLSNFLDCREATRLRYVEGWAESSINRGLEFGTAFHKCKEYTANNKPTSKISSMLRQHYQSYAPRMNSQQKTEFLELMGLVEVTYLAYLDRYMEDDSKKKFIIREDEFAVTHIMPNGRRIPIRGRIDGAYINSAGETWLMENKTKGHIDPIGIEQQLTNDLQTMLYLYCAPSVLLGKGHRVDLSGVCYNVVRRPELRVKQGENNGDFLKRVAEDMKERPKWYFYRWFVEVTRDDMGHWVETTLNPILGQVVSWWESIRNDPFDPWGRSEMLHFKRPPGLFQSSEGRGQFFDLQTRGSNLGLILREKVFPELDYTG